MECDTSTTFNQEIQEFSRSPDWRVVRVAERSAWTGITKQHGPVDLLLPDEESQACIPEWNTGLALINSGEQRSHTEERLAQMVPGEGWNDVCSLSSFAVITEPKLYKVFVHQNIRGGFWGPVSHNHLFMDNYCPQLSFPVYSPRYIVLFINEYPVHSR